VVNTTDIVPQAGVIRPAGETDVEFEFTEQSEPANVYTVPEGNGVRLTERVTDNLIVKANLSGSELMSPIILPHLQILTGVIAEEGDYITRAIVADEDFDVIVTFEVFKPSGATCTPSMEIQTMDGLDPLIIDDVYQSEYIAMVKDSVTRLSDGWLEETWKVEELRGVGLDWNTRCKLELTGGPAARVQVRKLRVIIK
jgi:hypothetical protein